MTKQQIIDMLQQHKVLLIYEGDKHQDEYYTVASLTEVRDAMCTIVQHRLRYYDREPLATPIVPELTEEAIDQLPDGEVKKAAVNQHKRYKRELRENEEALAEIELLKRVATTGDLEAAIELLEKRSSYEYEGFSITAGNKADPWEPFELESTG